MILSLLLACLILGPAARLEAQAPFEPDAARTRGLPSALTEAPEPEGPPPANDEALSETSADESPLETVAESDPETKPVKRGDRDFLSGARKFGRGARRALGRMAGELGDSARKLGRSAEKKTRRFIDRLSHRSSDLTTGTTLANLALVLPGTDLGVRLTGQVDKWGHYDPAWAHSQPFVDAIRARWPDSQVKLFTWLSGPDPLTIDSAANGLYHFLYSWRAANPGRKVYVYAHSNGGNVAMHAAARYRPAAGQSELFIDELITAGTPLRPADKMSTKYGAIGRLVFVFTRHDWVAGDVHGTTPDKPDPRKGIVPEILGAGYTPELAVLSRRTRKSGPILSPAPHQYVVPLEASAKTMDQEVSEIYGPDFLARRAAGSIGEVDASDIVAGHSDYNRPEVSVAILDLVARYDRGLVPDAQALPVTLSTTETAAESGATTGLTTSSGGALPGPPPPAPITTWRAAPATVTPSAAAAASVTAPSPGPVPAPGVPSPSAGLASPVVSSPEESASESPLVSDSETPLSPATGPAEPLPASAP